MALYSSSEPYLALDSTFITQLHVVCSYFILNEIHVSQIVFILCLNFSISLFPLFLPFTGSLNRSDSQKVRELLSFSFNKLYTLADEKNANCLGFFETHKSKNFILISQ
jgi:hypothetical protein